VFGNTTLIKEETREMWGWPSTERIAQDLSHALRLFRKAPGFTAIVIFTLTLGIAATTAMFSLLNAVLLQPLPYPNSDRLVAIWDRDIHVKGVSKIFDLYSDYDNWKKNSQTFEAFAAVSWAPRASPVKILTEAGRSRTIFALPVTADFFSLLGTPPMVGRTFNAADTGRGCMVVLANSFWHTTFGGQKAVVGKSIRLDDQACTVLGIMPPGFAFLPPEAVVSMWRLLPPLSQPGELPVGVFGRLRPGVSILGAQAELSLLHRQIHAHDRWGAQMEPMIYRLHGEFTWLTGRNLRLSLIVLFASAAFVLLICCVNVANLLLGRTTGRVREMAIRAALGSGRGRLLRQLLTENLLFSLAASITGTALAAAVVRYFRIARPIEMPPGTKLELDAPVLAFAVALSILTTVVFGLAPAWRASKADLNAMLKTGGRSHSRDSGQQRFGKGLVVAEVMLTVMLLAGAGLLIQAVNRFATAPLGFQPDGLLIASLSLPPSGYQEPQRKLQFFERLQTQLVQRPEVQGVALSNTRPIEGGGGQDVIEVEGHPAPRLENAFDTYHQTITPDYFAVMNTPLKEGRYFESGDTLRTEPVAIINEALVRKYFSNEDPIGTHIRPFQEGKNTAPWLRIAGVVGDEKRTTVYQEMAWADSPVIYRPLSQDPLGSANIIIRTSGVNRNALGGEIQRQIARIDPRIPVDDVQTVSDLEAKAAAYPSLRAKLLGTFAGLAVILAIVGLFGVLSHLVAQRTQEIGVRMALGAQKTAILAMILKQGLVLTGTGMVLGTAAAWLLGRYLAALLYGVRPTNLLLLALLALVLLPAALIAMYLPARQAAQVDPMVALRCE
jgi:putative ABC transport system permease protein